MPRLVGPAIPPGRLARLAQPVLDLTDMALRPWQSSDVSAVAAAYSDPDIRYWHARSMTEAEARVWIDSWPVRWAQESGAGWAIADEAGLLGQISLRRLHLSDGIAEISYWIVPAARGRRVATRALSTLTSWAFARLGLHRLEVNHSTMNSVSCRVAENAGYAMEGTKRGEALHPDGWHDMHLHARLSSDPPHEGRSSN